MPADPTETRFRVAIDYARDGTPRIGLEGELDIACLTRLRRLFDAVLADCARLVLDLRELRFVDLPGVRLLAELSARAAGCACELEVSGATGQVARLLDLMPAGSRPPLRA